MSEELTDEEIQHQLAGNGTGRQKRFRGKPLATLTAGLRDLWFKSIKQDDTATFADAALVYLLLESKAEPSEDKRIRRQAIIERSDDRARFRAEISLFLDELNDEEQIELRKLTNEIFGLVEKAEVAIAEKKTELDPEESSLIQTPS